MTSNRATESMLRNFSKVRIKIQNVLCHLCIDVSWSLYIILIQLHAVILNKPLLDLSLLVCQIEAIRLVALTHVCEPCEAVTQFIYFERVDLCDFNMFGVDTDCPIGPTCMIVGL